MVISGHSSVAVYLEDNCTNSTNTGPHPSVSRGRFYQLLDFLDVTTAVYHSVNSLAAK